MRKFILLIFSVVLCLTFSSCLTRTEIVDTAIIQAIGIDRIDDEYIITLQKFSPHGSTSLNEGARADILQVKGESISEAMNKIGFENGQELYLGNTQLLLIGKKTAKDGISSIVGFIGSSYQIRPSIHIAIADETAADIITNAPMSDGIVTSEAIDNLLKRTDYNSGTAGCTIMQVIDALQHEGTDPFIPLIELSSSIDGKLRFFINGTCIFSDDKLVDVLSANETCGFSFITGDAKLSDITIKDKVLGTTSIQLHSVKVHRKIDIVDGLPVFNIKVNCIGAVNRNVSVYGGGINANDINTLEQAVNRQLKKEMQLSVKTALIDNHSDIFNFAKHLKQQQPAYWKINQNHWKEIAPKCKFVFEVNCNINRTGTQAKY